MATDRPDTEEGAANLALAHLRQPPIAKLTDDNSRARAVRAVFGAARDASLRMRWWNFATGWATPAKAAGIVRPGRLRSAHPLPDDCLLVRFVEDAGADAWAVEAAKADPAGSEAEVSVLVTNMAAPLICYTRRIAAVRLWDPEFLVCFSYQLAAFAGPQLGKPAGAVRELQELADRWRDDASESDANEKANSQVTRSTSWVTARRRGGSRR